MEKYKTKKAKTLQIKYPLPYTQSWPSAERPPKHKKITYRSSSKKYPPLTQRCWPCTQPRQRIPDPTVPHLKYGIFPKKASLARGPSKIVIAKPSKLPSPPEARTNSNLNRRPARPVPLPLPETPIFVFRAIDKNSTRQLSMSETMHVDVKPRRFPPTSPPLRNISPNTTKNRRNI